MNYYEILGVDADATDQQIKEGYRREAMMWHPDRHEGVAAKAHADKRFKDLALAYRTLRDASARADYDRQLKHKLNQDFEARQREQARQRQEQAQKEAQAQAQAKQQKQANREPPKQDFADTRPPFEDETMSGADADQMFREQMLDLATELAGRGFPEFNIFKALVALGCPENMAKVVATIAAQQSQQQSSSQPRSFQKAAADTNAAKSKSEPSKDDFYRAAIGPINQEFFLAKFKKFDQRGSAGITWPGVGQFFAGFFWLFYRRMPRNAWLFLGLPFVLLLLIYMVFGTEVKDDSTPMNLYNIVIAIMTWLVLPSTMNAMYYNAVNRKILAVKAETNDRVAQLALLTKMGGTNNAVVWLVSVLTLISILAAVALPVYQDYTRKAKQTQVTADQAAKEQTRQLAVQQAQMQSKADYDRTLLAIEAQFPQLNPDSQQYNQAAEAWVVERKKIYDDAGGRSPAATLQQAVDDYAAALEKQQPKSPQSSFSSQYGADLIQKVSVELFDGIGAKLSLNFQDIEIRSLVQVISDFSGRNFYIDDSVKTSVSINVTDMPWTEVILYLIDQHDLSIIKVQSGYYIFPISISDQTALQRAAQKGL